MSAVEQPRPAISGIEWLRAICSVGIVEWHLHVINRSGFFDAAAYREHHFDWSDFVNFYVLLAAVPIFIAVSCYLFALRERNWDYLQRRVRRLGLLLLFWPVALHLWSDSFWPFLSNLPRSPHEWPEYILRAGSTPYYFFVCLLFCTVLCYAAARLRSPVVGVACGLACLLVGLLPWLAVAAQEPFWTVFWNPLNFLPYPFASILLVRYLKRSRPPAADVTLCVALGVIAALLGCLEWHFYPNLIHFAGNDMALPAYTRLSVFFLAYLALAGVLLCRLKTNAVIHYMADNSLALYCLHGFLAALSFRLALRFPIPLAYPQVKVAMTIGLSYLAAHALRSFLREGLLH